ncbi:G2/M phase-specific E3 ubiquitin-protein ligase-like [Pseudopipra pipra]|uniref:G2/M phase-specific E3 ubiquitin-protein ligase-like n=1 Tax=Pseudopipra pipra TaxID=415032 RepID=UPI003138C127
MLDFIPSCAPSAEVLMAHFAGIWPSWGSESPSGWCPSAWLTTQGVQVLCCSRACPSSPGPALFRESRVQLPAGVGNGTGGRQGHPAAARCQGRGRSSVFPFPIRESSEEDINAFVEFGERHRHCDANECLFPGGRQEAQEGGPWELLLCSSCAAEGTHRACSGLRASITSWECDSCAGLGTASRDDLGLAGFSVARQSELEPSDSSREPETISPNTGSLALPGLSPSSSALETVSPSTSAHSENNSGRQHRAQNPQLRSRSPLDRSHVPAPSPGRRRPTQRQSGTSCRRNRSRLQRQEPCASTKSWEAQVQAETLRDIPQAKPLPPATSDPKSIRPVQKSP